MVKSVAVRRMSLGLQVLLFNTAAEVFAAGIVPADGKRCKGVFSPPFGVQLPSDISRWFDRGDV